MKDSRLMRWIVGCIAAVAVAGCVSETTSGEGTGSLSLDLVIGEGIVINQVDWQLTGNEMDMSGAIDVSAPGSTASVEVFGLPPGEEDYTVTLTALSEDEEVSCEGSADFNVEVGQSTPVMVVLNCKLPQRLGSVRVNGKFNICAELTKATAAPLRTSVGNDIALTSEAEDADGNPIQYMWTATSGSLDNPSAPSTTYTCTEAGDHFITIQVTDNDAYCDMATWIFSVTCVPGAIECTDPSQCEDNRECTTNLCENLDCVYEPIAAGEACPVSDGVCDGEGDCVQCVGAGDCPDDGLECTEAPSCTDNTCDPQDNLPDGTACTGVANGMCMDGVCVPTECTDPGDCEDERECTTNLCEEFDCVYEPIAAGESCPVSDGVCDGEGDCVQCVGAGDCPDDGLECTEAPSCTDNTCDPQDNLPDGTDCAGAENGMCMDGACVPTVCTDPSQCEDDRECTTNLCEDLDCVFEPIAAEESCPESDGVCDGEGNCVECVSAANCPDDELECTTNLCEAEECVYEPIAAGESCPVSDGVCDGAGDCVQCVGPGDCPDDGNECTEAPSCTDNTCDPQDNLPDNTECSIGTCQAGVCEPTPDACFECQQTNCQDYLGSTVFADCYDDTTLAEGGPAAGTPKNQLCETYLDCALTMPAETGDPACGAEFVSDPTLCYCGPGFDQNPAGCEVPDAAEGPCIPEAEAAAESTDPKEVSARWPDPDFAIGSANRLLRCINANCTSECYP